MTGIEQQTMRRIWWRIVPLLSVVLMFNYLDKVNLGFAAVTMNGDLGFSNTVFGAGAGFFALGYALFAVPSTLLLHRLGARRWISIMMVAWGTCSAATAFVTTAQELFVVRFFLGMAEAGFTPGAILYFSYWFPSAYRGRVLSAFLLIYPLGLVIGGPASSALFALDGVANLAGWQWLFLVEALPTLVLAFIVYGFLTDSPEKARWIMDEQKRWLAERLAAERSVAQQAGSTPSAWRAFGNRKVWVLAAANLALSTSGIAPVFFMPLIIQSTGFSASMTGLLVALPGIAGGLALPLWGAWTDRAERREIVVAVACIAMAVGLVAAAFFIPSPWTIAALCLAMIGFNGCLVAFWTLPTAFLIGAGAATGIAFINIVGNLGTFTGPYLMGFLADRTQSYVAGLICLAAIAIVAALIMALARLGRAPSAALERRTVIPQGSC